MAKQNTHDGIPLDSTSGIEAHGIDHIPANERYGTPRQLFGVWATSQVNYIALLIGAILIGLGLSFWQAVGVIVVGNAFAIVTGYISASGPASGTPSQIIQRAIFGVRGNLPNQIVTGWLINVFFLALNWAAAGYIVFAELESWGLAVDNTVKAVVIVLIAAATLVISVYGYNFITRNYQTLSWALIGIFVVATLFLAGGVTGDATAAPGLDGIDFWAMAFAGVALIATGPLSYTNAADFARYLPAKSSISGITWWVTLGFMVPNVFISTLGAYVTAAMAAEDPQAAIESILPTWFAPIFTLAVVVGTIANNAMTAYSSGLVLQTIGIKLRRSLTVIADGILGTIITLFALLVWNFLDSVSTLLQLIVGIIAPLCSVYVADIWMRRNVYSGVDLEKTTASSPYWYRGGYNWAGIVSFLVGLGATLLFVWTDFYVGPLFDALGGVDISLEVAIVLPAVIYYVWMRRSVPREHRASR